ncbi:MAG: GAF domain-containing protein [Chloroflexota bacterium]
MREAERNYFRDLYEVAAAINSAGTSDSVLKSIVANVAKALKAKGSSIMLLTPDKKSLIHSISYGLSEAFTDSGPRSVEKSLPETVVGKGKEAIVYDVATEGNRVQFPELAKKEGIVSILAVPMRLRDDIIGQLRVYTAEPRHFSDNDRYFVQAVANLGAIALENARLVESSQNAYEALTRDFLSFRFTRGGPTRYS